MSAGAPCSNRGLGGVFLEFVELAFGLRVQTGSPATIPGTAMMMNHVPWVNLVMAMVMSTSRDNKAPTPLNHES